MMEDEDMEPLTVYTTRPWVAARLVNLSDISYNCFSARIEFSVFWALSEKDSTNYKEVIKGKDEDAEATDEYRSLYESLLGSAAWTVLTRAEVAIYVQALQRRGAAPRVFHVKRCNLVIIHLRRFKCGIEAVRLAHPLKITGFTQDF